MSDTTTREYTADDLRADFLELDVRSIPVHDMWALLADHVNKEDYIVALDALRREGHGVTVIHDGRRHLARVS